MSFSRVQQWASFSKTWWLYDAKWQCPFRSALVLREYIQGRHKPLYTPQSILGDPVVVINSRHIAVDADYWQRWKHYEYTGYAGGDTATPLFRVHELDPTKVLWTCVYRSMKGTTTRRHNMGNLHIYPDGFDSLPPDLQQNVSDQIQQIMPVPKGLEDYSSEERSKFPRLFEYPEEHVLNPIPKYKKPKDAEVSTKK